MMCGVCVLLSLAALLQCSAQIQEPLLGPEPGYIAKGLLSDDFSRFVEHVNDKWAVQGICVAVVRKDSSGKWHRELKGWGVANRFGEPVTEDTLFNIASNSKLFTALSLGLLVENDTFHDTLDNGWDTKVRSIIPDWSPQDPVLREYGNLVDILSHRTGLPRHDYSYGPGESLEDVVASVQHLKSSTEFRLHAQYNNIMYATAAYIVQKISRVPFTQFVEKNIFAPLGLASTTYSVSTAFGSRQLAEGYAVSRENVTQGEGWYKNEYRPIPYWGDDASGFNAGAGGVISSAKDMATWVQALLSNGKHPETGDVVIPETAVKHAATGASIFSGTTDYPDSGPHLYGAGHFIYHYQGHQLIEHGGATPGFRSQITRFPDDNLGIVLLSNSDTSVYAIEIIKYRIVEEYLGLPKVDWDSRLVDAVRKRKAKLAELALARPTNPIPPTRPTDSLAGTYWNPAYGLMELCAVPSHDPLGGRTPHLSTSKTSPSCEKIISSTLPLLSELYPSPSSSSAPQLIAHFPRIWLTHFILTHYDQDTFNITAWCSIDPASNPTARDPGEKPFVVPVEMDDPDAEVGRGLRFDYGLVPSRGPVVSGFGWTGMWGAGEGVHSPVPRDHRDGGGRSVKEWAEVWFDRI